MDAMPKKPSTKQINKSTKAGKFVSNKDVKNKPSTTVSETKRSSIRPRNVKKYR